MVLMDLSAHVVDSEDREDSDTRSWDQLYVVDNRLTSSGRWWKTLHFILMLIIKLGTVIIATMFILK